LKPLISLIIADGNGFAQDADFIQQVIHFSGCILKENPSD
jgi:hypothetical protein